MHNNDLIGIAVGGALTGAAAVAALFAEAGAPTALATTLAATAQATSGVLGNLASNYLGSGIDRFTKRLRESPSDILHNRDLQRLVGRTIAAKLDALADDASSQVSDEGRSTLKMLAVRAEEFWSGEAADHPAFRGLNAGVIANYFSMREATFEKAVALNPDLWKSFIQGLQLDLAHAPTRSRLLRRLRGLIRQDPPTELSHTDLNITAAALHTDFPHDLFTVAKQAFADNDPSYAALQLRLMRELMTDVRDTLATVHGIARDQQELKQSIHRFLDAVHNAAPVTLAAIPPASRPEVSAVVADIESLRSESLAILHRLESKIDALASTSGAIRDEVHSIAGLVRGLRRRRGAIIFATFVVLVIAVTVGGRLAGWWSGAASADAAGFRKLAAELDIDPSRLSAGDFSIRVEQPYNLSGMVSLRVTPRTASLRSFASQTGLQFRVGDRPWAGVWAGMPGSDDLTAILGPADLEATGNLQLRINPVAVGYSIGRSFGPYEYNVHVADMLADDLAAQASKAQWLEKRSSEWAVPAEVVTRFGEAVRAISVGADPQNLLPIWQRTGDDHPRLASALEDYKENHEAAMRLHVELGGRLQPFRNHDVLFARIELARGRSTEVMEFRPEQHDDAALYMPQRAEIPDDFVGVEGHSLRFDRFFEFGDQVEKVLVGRTPVNLDHTIDVLKDAPAERLDHWRIMGAGHGERVPLNPSWDTVYVQLVLKNGSRSEIRELKLEDEPGVTWIPAVPADGDPVGSEPAVFFRLSNEHRDTHRIVLGWLSIPPRNTSRIVYSHDGSEWKPAHASMSNPWNSLYDLSSLSGSLHLLIQLNDGTEVGPHRYTYSGVAEAVRAFVRPTVKTRRRELLTVVRVPADVFATRVGILTNGMGGWEARSDAERLVCALRTYDVAWCAVREVRLGASPNALEHSLRPGITAEDAVGELGLVRSDGQRQIHMLLPPELETVYAQFVLDNGDVLEPFELAITKP